MEREMKGKLEDCSYVSGPSTLETLKLYLEVFHFKFISETQLIKLLT